MLSRGRLVGASRTKAPARFGNRIPAPEGRQLIARGVSPWRGVRDALTSPGGTAAPSPLRGWDIPSNSPSPGACRPWLLTAAPYGAENVLPDRA